MFSQACVSHSVHNQPHDSSFTVNPCYGAFGTYPTRMLSCWSNIYHPQTKFAKVMFLQVCVCPQGREGVSGTCQGGMHGWVDGEGGTCGGGLVWQGGMHGQGDAWLGGMHGRGHVW